MEKTDRIRGRILSNLGRMMQFGGPIAEDRPKGDLAVRTCSCLCLFSLSIFCYFIRFRVMRVFMSYFIRFGISGYKYMLKAYRKDSY